MAVGVGNYSRRPKQDNGFANMLTLGGMAAGAVAGGPAGAMTGASLGGAAAGILQPKQPEQVANGAIATNAIDRRMQKLDQSPMMQIRESIDSLKYVQDPSMKEALAGPLVQASILARRNPGV
jgi:hypothetical protein